MLKFLLFLSFPLFFLRSGAQDTGTAEGQHDSFRQSDSQVIKIETVQDSLDLVSMNKDLAAFFRLQKEKEKQQRRQTYIRVALGIFIFILLVIGVTRKRKK